MSMVYLSFTGEFANYSRVMKNIPKLTVENYEGKFSFFKIPSLT